MTVPTTSTRAIVSSEPKDGQLNWKLENVTVREIGPDEVLVRVVASGICHTDVLFGLWPAEMIPYPKVLGHEGAGVVVKTGADVKVAGAGDPVLLSFQHCTACKSCQDGHPAYCQEFAAINYGGDGEVYTTSGGEKLRGAFFGQSSFAQLAVVKATSVVNVKGIVKDEEELKVLAPLGCGFQTGMGTVDKVAGAGENDTVVVLGLGGVGLVSIMAAKIKGCKAVIGVDRVPGRLELATEVGATHVINTAGDVDFGQEILKITSGHGSTVTIDTTGNMDLIRAGMGFTASRGQLIFVGVPPPEAMLEVHLIQFLQSGKILRGCIEGDATPSEYLPEMIQLYREGKLPLNKIVKFYPAEDFHTALADMKSGATVKPVITW